MKFTVSCTVSGGTGCKREAELIPVELRNPWRSLSCEKFNLKLNFFPQVERRRLKSRRKVYNRKVARQTDVLDYTFQRGRTRL